MAAAPATNSPVKIDALPCGKGIQRFLNVARAIYRDDPQYVVPLDQNLKERLDPKRGAFFRHGEAMLFVAHRDGRDLGRACASIDQEHLRVHRDGTGFFGFIDTIDDPEVCKSLLEAAGAWLKGKGLTRMLGPISLSMHHEVGCLVDGFDTSPMIYMPHHRSYQSKLIEAAGLTKERDLYAFRYVVGEVPPRARRAHDEVTRMPEVRFRTMDPSRLETEVRLLADIFNDAWSSSWGFVPCTEAEIQELLSGVTRTLLPEIVVITEIHGEPAAMSVCLPNINELIRDLDGKLLPLGLARLQWRLKVKGATSARVALLGIRQKYRGVKRYGGLSTALCVETNDRNRRAGIKWAELSWTLEDHAAMIRGIKAMGGRTYKTYRLYARPL